MVTSASNTTTSHAGKCGRAMTGADAPIDGDLDFIAGLSMKLTKNYQIIRNISTHILQLLNATGFKHCPHLHFIRHQSTSQKNNWIPQQFD